VHNADIFSIVKNSFVNSAAVAVRSSRSTVMIVSMDISRGELIALYLFNRMCS
jgi:hypothetical protein